MRRTTRHAARNFATKHIEFDLCSTQEPSAKGTPRYAILLTTQIFDHFDFLKEQYKPSKNLEVN